MSFSSGIKKSICLLSIAIANSSFGSGMCGLNDSKNAQGALNKRRLPIKLVTKIMNNIYVGSTNF